MQNYTIRKNARMALAFTYLNHDRSYRLMNYRLKIFKRKHYGILDLVDYYG